MATAMGTGGTSPVRTSGARTHGKLLSLALLLAFAVGFLPAGGGVGVGVEEASANHGRLMTLRGKVLLGGRPVAGQWVSVYNSAGQRIGNSVSRTDAGGNFAVVVGRGHSYYLGAGAQYGRCVVSGGGGVDRYEGYTGLFALRDSTPNPSYIDIHLRFWATIC